MTPVRKAFLLAAVVLSSGLVGSSPARAQLGSPRPFGGLLALGMPMLAPSVTPAAAGGTPLGRPPASPISVPGPVIAN